MRDIPVKKWCRILPGEVLKLSDGLQVPTVAKYLLFWQLIAHFNDHIFLAYTTLAAKKGKTTILTDFADWNYDSTLITQCVKKTQEKWHWMLSQTKKIKINNTLPAVTRPKPHTVFGGRE